MSREIRADYDQMLLLPSRVEDWVGPDHPARFVRSFVDSLSLEELGFKARKSQVGRSNYAADLLLKVTLYGWLTRVRSARMLEKGCCENMAFIWLTGNQPPDHNTIWRFFRNNKAAFRGLFRQMVKVAEQLGLLGLTLHAVDGTKIAAAVSRRGAWHQDQIDAAFKEFEQGLSEAQVREKLSYRLPEDLKEEGMMQEKIRAAHKALEEAGTRHLAPGEGEARMMKMRSGKRFGYNAQAVVDAKEQLIVAAEVTNEASDGAQLVKMLDQTQETLGRTAEQTVADGGYNSAEQLGLAEEKGYSVVVGKSGTEGRDGGKYAKEKFHYEQDRDVWVCPLGEALCYQRTKSARGGRPEIKVYRCRRRDCPEAGQCSRDKRGRSIETCPHEGALMRQRAKREAVGEELLKRRSAVVEPVFAWVKWALGFRRWTVRGLEGVRAQWHLMCAAVNLMKLYGAWKDGKFAIEALGR